MKSEQIIRVLRDGEVISEVKAEGSMPKIEVRDPSGIKDLNGYQSVRASACIYCGSTDRLSREHVAPYALGGTLTIVDGSCESCRLKTHTFETHVLTGPMRMVRYLQKMPSRSKHRDVKRMVPVRVTMTDGTEQDVQMPIEEAPVLLAFSEFGEPKYLEPNRGVLLEAKGVVTGTYARHPDEVIKTLAVPGLSISQPPTRPHAFAQMIAKIAYCFAYIDGFLNHVENPDELVHAFMNDPDTLGRFVGSMPPPFVSYDKMSLRLSLNINSANRLAWAQVQLFAHSGAPTYVVVLGRLKSNIDLSAFGLK